MSAVTRGRGTGALLASRRVFSLGRGGSALTQTNCTQWRSATMPKYSRYSARMLSTMANDRNGSGTWDSTLMFIGIATAGIVGVTTLPPYLRCDEADLATLTEESSGLPFAKTVTITGAEQQLMGAGIRKIFWVSTYAVGLYLELDSLRKQESFAKATVEELKKKEGQQAVFDSITSYDFPGSRTIRIISTRSAAGAHIRDGLITTLLKRLTAVSPEEKDAAIEQFKTLFPKDFIRGTTLDFTWKQGGDLVVSVDGTVVGKCESKALARAVFQSYLDKDSKASQPKSKWASGLVALKEGHSSV